MKSGEWKGSFPIKKETMLHVEGNKDRMILSLLSLSLNGKEKGVFPVEQSFKQDIA